MAGDQEFPVPLERFLKTLVGTPDEVWSHLMRVRHRRGNETMTKWRMLLEAHQKEPV